MTGRGPRRQPRRHVLPLVKEASDILERRLGQTPAEVPALQHGWSHADAHRNADRIVRRILKEMVQTKEAREAFQLRDLRPHLRDDACGARGIERRTAQLQSHGLGGVQQRHYDRHDYALEKYQALQTVGAAPPDLRRGRSPGRRRCGRHIPAAAA